VTIILSLVTAHYVLQASDRLLTVEKAENRYEPWDPASNKSVIVLARDGLISMGYSGPAFISSVPVDGWIAEVLAGADLGAGGSGCGRGESRPDFGVSIGGTRPAGILARQLATVARRLDQAVRTSQISNPLSIYFVGFRWQSLKKPAWPVFGRIVWDKVEDGYKITMSKRRWGWESGRNYLFRALGRSESAAQISLRNRLLSIDLRSKEQAAVAMIDVLRSLPPHDPTVSKDCLVTTIQRTSPHVHIKYEPHDIGHVLVASRSRSTIVPAAFTPWIVTPRLIASPQMISGPGCWTYHCGGLDFQVEGPDSGGDLSIMSSQPRRRP
jgi:hypothetical protein